jgi:hypothetical protein
VDTIFACFYLTGQLKSILQKFQLAGVVLVVSNPHVFNLTGQLESKPPEFPTLAATALSRSFKTFQVDLFVSVCFVVPYFLVGKPRRGIG